MKRHITPINIIIVLLFIYSIVMTFVAFKPEPSIGDVKIQYMQEKIDMLERVNDLEIKIHNYEIELLNIDNTVRNWSESERDSARNVLNPR